MVFVSLNLDSHSFKDEDVPSDDEMDDEIPSEDGQDGDKHLRMLEGITGLPSQAFEGELLKIKILMIPT